MLKFDVNLSLLFGSVPMEQRPRAAAAAGFGAVEMWWPFDGPSPSDKEMGTIATAVRDAGVRLVALNFDAGDMSSGDRGLVSLPGETARFRESVGAAIELANQVGGVAVFNALYGNRLDGVAPQAQDETAMENLAYACRQVAGSGAKVVLEALNTFENPRYPITSTAGARRCIDAVAEATGETVWYLYDCYHMQRMEGNTIATVREHAGSFGHVQLADSPGRDEPGRGEVNYRNLLAAVAESGYTGWVGLEYRPSGDPSAGFDWIEEMGYAR